MRAFLLLASLTLAACTTSRAPEDSSDWFGDFEEFDVEDPVLFTDVPYEDPMYTDGIGQMRNQGLFNGFGFGLSRKYAAGEVIPNTNCTWENLDSDDDRLPNEFWAMVTIHPRYYYKNEGCQPRTINGVPVTTETYDSEEKYYGNFFIEDASGGLFVLNDSKVAHFNMGDRVRIRVRGVGSRFDLDAVVAHDIVEVDHGPHPIFFTPNSTTTCSGVPASFDSSDPEQLAAFGERNVECEFDDTSLLGRTVRVEGKVLSSPDTFGGFFVEDANGDIVQVSLDSEINRRKWSWPVGSQVRVTGPVLNAFGHSIAIMRVGQVESL